MEQIDLTKIAVQSEVQDHFKRQRAGGHFDRAPFVSYYKVLPVHFLSENKLVVALEPGVQMTTQEKLRQEILGTYCPRPVKIIFKTAPEQDINQKIQEWYK
jgi:hypothetical protein